MSDMRHKNLTRTTIANGTYPVHQKTNEIFQPRQITAIERFRTGACVFRGKET
jgi:hypothetical protein